MIAQPAEPAKPATSAEQLRLRFRQVRDFTNHLCVPLAPEDQVIQSMPDVSPTRWHLAHTSWFFETFILSHFEGFKPFHPQYTELFNSYYESIGKRTPRPRRGLLSRPTVAEIMAYREYVDEQMIDFLTVLDEGKSSNLAPAIELGLNHEQQHQELILTDIKHVLGQNPLHPVYRAGCSSPLGAEPPPLRWVDLEGGARDMGHDGQGFAYDNEAPRHKVILRDYQLASRPVLNAEYMEFIADGGYRKPLLWLSDGWAKVTEEQWETPLYWQRAEGGDAWNVYTLGGFRRVDPCEPVCHLSFYEADAYARWMGARLPTEQEWEHAAVDAELRGNFAESERCHPAGLSDADAGGLTRLYGDVWEWTASPYMGYPGYKPASGAIGEYNGKFMCNQMVLRGGSCATPQSHIRRTYRNFFHPSARWQFSGLRLAR